ncbi:Hypothetical predicted protein [Olea europaea subsp. europaea]|nr:Hypothetical predicted protein [Olea europaea subsp. europaea]
MTPVTVSNGKNSNPIKVVKRDGNSLRIKLAVGGIPEKILTAFKLVHDEDVNEEAALNQFRSAVPHVQEIEKDVENISSQGNLRGSDLVDKIQEQENTVLQCVRQLENAEAIRVALVSQLKEALEDQESKLMLIQSELHVAHGLIEQAAQMRQQLAPGFSVPLSTNQLIEANTPRMVEPKLTINLPAPPPTQPLTPFSISNISEEESKKATVAAVAAKLAASTSSAQMLTSVLSSLVAEEAASMSSSLKSAGWFSSLPTLPPEKRQKLEKSVPFSDVDNSESGNSMNFSTTQQVNANIPPTNMHSVAQTNRMQAPFLPPPPPLPPLAPPSNSPASQLVQSAMVVPPCGYGAGNLLPPSLSTNNSMGLAGHGPPQQAQPQQLQNQQPQQQPQQPLPPNAGYYRPPGIGFYGHSHQTSTPPVPRQ